MLSNASRIFQEGRVAMKPSCTTKLLVLAILGRAGHSEKDKDAIETTIS
jgi:hypothetical protein